MLTQEMLNVETRNEAYLDILMFVQNKNIRITDVSSNSTLSFSNLSSIIDLDQFSSNKLATLERNLWLLDGTFFNPNKGQLYSGYISNDMSNDNGEFETNPKITLTLLQPYEVEYFSMVLNASITDAYPKQITTKFLDKSGNVIKTITTDTETVETLPNIILEVKAIDVKQVEIEFVGTQVPHRRIRMSTAMFGKLETFTQEQVTSSNVNDKSSLVADSIASRLFSFTLLNYDKKYNIDNPSNDLPVLDRSTEVMMRWGYNNDGLIEYTDMVHFRLLSVTSNEDNTVTFECGSILDMMDMQYDQDIYPGKRTVTEVVTQLLTFAGVPTDTVVYDAGFDTAIIDRPLPEMPVKELIQLCAFSCGATIMILDSGKIRFADLDLTVAKSSFTYDNFTSIPRAEQLSYTYDIALTKTSSKVDSQESQLTKVTVNTFQVSISYSAAMSPYVKSIVGGTVVNAKYYTTHCELELNFTGDNCEIEIWGYKITTTTNTEKSATSSTLILDSQLALNPSDKVKNKYKDWYSKRFKYVMSTRGEPLVKATNVISIQSPFTVGMLGYVLANNISFNGSWSGDMEVIAL